MSSVEWQIDVDIDADGNVLSAVVEERRELEVGDRGAEPYECDTDERRIISAYCCTCEAETTLYLEVGDSEPWEHDAAHPSHVIDYWRDT